MLYDGVRIVVYLLVFVSRVKYFLAVEFAVFSVFILGNKYTYIL